MLLNKKEERNKKTIKKTDRAIGREMNGKKKELKRLEKRNAGQRPARKSAVISVRETNMNRKEDDGPRLPTAH